MPRYVDLPKVTDHPSLMDFCEMTAINHMIPDDLVIELPEEEHKRIYKIHSGGWSFQEEFEVPAYVGVGGNQPTTFWLKFVRSKVERLEKLKCLCDIYALMREGCRCGCFEKEKRLKNA